MKKIIVLAMILISARSQALTENQKNDIKNDFNTAQTQIIAQELIGQYAGSCFDQYADTDEALYVNAFTNFNGETQILPLSTLQFYGGYTLPEKLKFLVTPTQENVKYVANFVQQGFTGVDNNKGHIKAGRDYAYIYSSEAAADQTALTLKVLDVKTSDSVTAPILRGCSYSLVKGTYVFEDCHAYNDQTVFKINGQGQLISKRTADERVKGTNNLSFRLPAIEKYCVWSKAN